MEGMTPFDPTSPTPAPGDWPPGETAETEPTTAKGRELLFDTRGRTVSAASDNLMVNAILAIEAEVRANQAATVEALREKLRRWHERYMVPECSPETCATAALLADTAKASGEWLAAHDAEVIAAYAKAEADRLRDEALSLVAHQCNVVRVGSVGAAGCTYPGCRRRLGWYCPDSADHLCHYSHSYDSCDFCRQPEERK